MHNLTPALSHTTYCLPSTRSRPLEHNRLLLALINHIFRKPLQELWILALVNSPESPSWCPTARIHHRTVGDATRQVVARDLPRALGPLVHERLADHDHRQEDADAVASVGWL